MTVRSQILPVSQWLTQRPSRTPVPDDEGIVTLPMEELWRRVRRWAKRHGHEVVPTYGVVGVGAT